MKAWKKIVFNILGCILFFFIGSVSLGIIIEDSDLACSICFKIILGYVFILSFISLIKKAKETIHNIKKENMKMILRLIRWTLIILPYIILWGILAALAFEFSELSNIALIFAFIALAIYILLLLIIAGKMNYEEYKEVDKKQVENLEKYIKNKK